MCRGGKWPPNETTKVRVMTDEGDSNAVLADQAAAAPPPDPASVAPPKRYKIGELAEFSGLSRQTLHNYTQWGLIRAVGWTAGGHRLYDETVFARLARILQWRSRFTVEQMRDWLEASGYPTSTDASEHAHG